MARRLGVFRQTRVIHRGTRARPAERCDERTVTVAVDFVLARSAAQFSDSNRCSGPPLAPDISGPIS